MRSPYALPQALQRSALAPRRSTIVIGRCRSAHARPNTDCRHFRLGLPGRSTANDKPRPSQFLLAADKGGAVVLAVPAVVNVPESRSAPDGFASVYAKSPSHLPPRSPRRRQAGRCRPGLRQVPRSRGPLRGGPQTVTLAIGATWLPAVGRSRAAFADRRAARRQTARRGAACPPHRQSRTGSR